MEASRFLETLLNDIVATLANSCVELVEHVDSCLPVNASVGDTDTVLEATRAFSGHFLAASVDVGLDHDTGDRPVTSCKLRADIIDDLGLVVVVLLRVTV